MAALLGGLFLVHGGLLRGDLPAGQRLPIEAFPLAVQTQRCLAAGDSTFHNPSNFLGESLRERPAAQVEYPPHRALLATLPAPRAVGTGLFAHAALALLGAFLFARALGLGPAAATLVATAFAYSGPLVGRLDAPHELATLAWLPVMAAVAVRERGILIAPLIALAVLAGAPWAAAVAALAAWVAAGCPRDKGTLAGMALGAAGSAVAWAAWRGPWTSARDPLSLLSLVLPFARGSALPVEPAIADGAPPIARVLDALGLTGGPGPWCGAATFGASVMYLGLVPLSILALAVPEGAPDRASRAGARLVCMGLVLALLGSFAEWLPAPSLGAAVLALGLALRAAALLSGPFRLRDPQLHAWAAFAIVAVGLAYYAKARGLGSEPVRLAVRGATLVGPDALAQLVRGGGSGAALALAFALTVLGALARLADGRWSPAGAALVLALLAYADQGLLFARRAFVAHPEKRLVHDSGDDRNLLGHLGLDPDRTMLVLHTGQHPRRALFDTLSPAQGLPALMRLGRANLVHGWPCLGGPDDETPPELARAFSRWPPDPVADASALRRAGVELVFADGTGFGRSAPAVGQVPLFGRPLFLHRLARAADAVLYRVVPQGRDPVVVRLENQPDRRAMELAVPGESVTRTAAPPAVRAYALELRSPALAVFPLRAGAWDARLDGAPAPLADAGGFAALEVPAGAHRAELTHRTAAGPRWLGAAAAAVWLFCCLLL